MKQCDVNMYYLTSEEKNCILSALDDYYKKSIREFLEIQCLDKKEKLRRRLYILEDLISNLERKI